MGRRLLAVRHGGADVLEFAVCLLDAAEILQALRQKVLQLDQVGGVPGRIIDHVMAQRSPFPVGLLVLLLQADTVDVFEKTGKTDTLHPEDPGRGHGVEDVPEGEGILLLELDDVVLAGMKNLHAACIGEEIAHDGKVDVALRIDHPAPVPDGQLDQADPRGVGEVAVLLRVHGEFRRARYLADHGFEISLRFDEFVGEGVRIGGCSHGRQ